MAESYDWIAIGPYGVYALMDTDCVPVREACDQHLAFLARMKSVSAALRPTPTQSPTDPAQGEQL